MTNSTHGVTQQDAQQFVSDVIRGWPSNQTFRAVDVLRSQPGLQDHASAVVDLAYEEYCRRCQQGETIEIEEFARQFPVVEETLLRLVALNQVFDRDPDLAQLSGSIQWPVVGQTFLEFNLLEELGRGLFSRVFLAHELELGDRPIVLKVSWGGRAEAFTLGQLRHAHIVPVNSVRHDPATELTAISLPFLGRATLFDVLSVLFSEGSEPKSARDLIDAVDLINHQAAEPAVAGDKTRQRSTWNDSFVDAVVRIGSQLADAVAHSHRLGIYHGDIKPSNVLITEDGNALLFDFNLSVNALGTTSRFGGTLPYMAPEQLNRYLEQNGLPDQQMDPRSELFSLGVTLFETLSGQHPFGPITNDRLGRDTAAVLVERQQSGPKSLRELNGDVDSMLAALIESTLAFDIDDRPQSCAEFASRLKALNIPRQRVRRRVINHPRLSLAALVLMILVFSLGMSAWVSLPPRHLRALRAAESQYVDGRFLEAAQTSADVLAEKPNSHRARFLRASCLMKAGRYRDARQEFSTLREQRSGDDRVVGCLANCLAHIGVAERDLGYIGDAKLQLLSIKQGAIKDSAYFNNLAYCELQLSHNSQAATALLAALRMGATRPRMRILLAEAERRLFLSTADTDDSLHLESATRHIGTVLNDAGISDSERSDALFQQAMVDATASLKLLSRDSQAATRLRDAAMDSLRDAVGHGLSEARLLLVAGVNPTIRQAADFEQLRERSQQNPAEDRLRWLMAPTMMEDILPTLPIE